MSVGTGAVLKLLVGLAKRGGHFRVARVGEFKNAPPQGLSFAAWIQSGPTPVARASGLASTSAMVRYKVRAHAFVSKPEDEVDARLADSMDDWIGALHADLTLGDMVRNVDVLGELGQPLDPLWGWLTVDNALYRISETPVTVIFNDVWEQVL